MTKRELDTAFNNGITVTFQTEGELNSFLRDMKEIGGTWVNGKEIIYDVNLLNSKKKSPTWWLTVSRDYRIAHLMAMLFCNFPFPSVPYSKFNTSFRTKEELKKDFNLK